MPSTQEVPPRQLDNQQRVLSLILDITPYYYNLKLCGEKEEEASVTIWLWENIFTLLRTCHNEDGRNTEGEMCGPKKENVIALQTIVRDS